MAAQWQLGGVLLSDAGFSSLGPRSESVCPTLTVSSSLSGQCRGQSSDVLSPALGPVVKPHLVPGASRPEVACWPELPSTAGKPGPQPTAPFPLWDLVSYFFRLWFGERNQHINDFFPQKPLNNSFWRVFAFLLAVRSSSR